MHPAKFSVIVAVLLFCGIRAYDAQVQSNASNRAIGQISWFIQDTTTGAIIDRGDTVVRLKDVIVQDTDVVRRESAIGVGQRPRELVKSVRLNDQFTLG